MTFLLELKERLRKIYIANGYIIQPILKFVLAMITFTAINNSIGFLSLFKNTFVLLLMALISALLPLKIIVVFSGIMILGHCFALGIEVAAIALCVVILLFIFAVRFVEKDSLAFIVTPLAFGLGIPCAVPICYGLKSRPQSAISICCGTFIYYFINVIQVKAQVLQGGDQAALLTNVRVILDGIVKDKMMFLSIAVMAMVLIVVFILRKLGLDYAWTIATFLGAGSYIVFMIAGGLFLDIEVSMLALIIGTIISAIIGVIMQFFVLSVDYSRTERLEFEDDEYYYYVKAVPKMSIGQSKRMVKTFIHEGEGNPLGDNREAADYDENDLERKLEESLREL